MGSEFLPCLPTLRRNLFTSRKFQQWYLPLLTSQIPCGGGGESPFPYRKMGSGFYSVDHCLWNNTDAPTIVWGRDIQWWQNNVVSAPAGWQAYWRQQAFVSHMNKCHGEKYSGRRYSEEIIEQILASSTKHNTAKKKKILISAPLEVRIPSDCSSHSRLCLCVSKQNHYACLTGQYSRPLNFFINCIEFKWTSYENSHPCKCRLGQTQYGDKVTMCQAQILIKMASFLSFVSNFFLLVNITH